MTVKRNRWLVISVLVVAIGAFLALSLLPLFAGRGDRATVTPPVGSPSESTDVQAELEARAKGYELVLEREPDNQTAIQGLVEARIQLGDLQGVVEPLEKLAELNPDVPEYKVLLGQTKQALGDLDGAADVYRTVLTDTPGDLNALQGLVALLIEQDRPQAAIGLLQDTLQTASQTNDITPGAIDIVSTKLLLAQVYVEQGTTDRALQLYDEVIDEAGDDFRPVLAKALVLQETGQPAEATELFQQAEAMAPAQFKDQVRQLATGPAASPSAAEEDLEAESNEAAEDESGASEPSDAESDAESDDGFIE